jgi:hypothetical protein
MKTTVNVGPLLVALSIVFTTYFGAALAVPAIPVPVQEALLSLPACLAVKAGGAGSGRGGSAAEQGVRIESHLSQSFPPQALLSESL